MKSEAMFWCLLTTIFSSFDWYSGNSFVKAAATSVADLKAAKNSMAGMAAFASGGGGGGDSRFMNAAPTGSISFHPREFEDYRDGNNGRSAVYDPGDELLRALSAELATNVQELGVLPEEPDYADTVFNELEVASKYEMMRKLERDLREEQEFVAKSALLMKMLADPTIETLPVVYVEDNSNEDTDENMVYPSEPAIGQVSKRARYYRRYPWKRHNRNRSTYEPELRYACTPSKEDVFKLLVNLHENRKGNHSKTVNFCNRKRPAKAVFTNIRFLG